MNKSRNRVSGLLPETCPQHINLLAVVLLSALAFDPTKASVQAGETLPTIVDRQVVAYEYQAIMGEAPIWHPLRNTLFWLDVHGKRLFEYIPEQKDCRTWDFKRKISTVVPESKVTVIVAQENELLRLDLDTGERERLAAIDDANGALRFNDGKCDPRGRFWVGTLRAKGSAVRGALYSFGPDGGSVRKIENVQNSNGLGWSPDQKWFYYIDSPTRQIARYHYDPKSGDIAYDGIAIPTKEYGIPDGMAIDAQGNLWVAITEKGVFCWNPTSGQLLRRVVLPAQHITACGFGGKALDELYITTARFGVATNSLKEFPLTGSLFMVKPGVQGVKPNLFGPVKH